MPKRYPPLKVGEVIEILTALGFIFHRHGRGDHDLWIRRTASTVYTVTVDTGVGQFDEYLLQSMIRQSGVNRDAFYGATSGTARKIGEQPPKGRS